jgi:hypothetical protein
MSRTAQINYKRVTFSFPEKVVETLRKKMGNQNMSKFVVEAVEEKLGDDWKDVDEFMEDLKEFFASVPKRDSRSSLEILREIRYGGKY